MLFEPSKIAGAFILAPQRHEDDRGHFARTFCVDELAAHGLVTSVAQCSVSWNRRAGTLRGMHYQIAPHEETKVVRCTAGAVFDVMLDMRPASPTFRQWQGVELTAANGLALYIPAGVAHGFQTLVDATEVFYMISTRYEPSAARGIRWDDPAFAIAWPPVAERTISERDRAFPLITH